MVRKMTRDVHYTDDPTHVVEFSWRSCTMRTPVSAESDSEALRKGLANRDFTFSAVERRALGPTLCVEVRRVLRKANI